MSAMRGRSWLEWDAKAVSQSNATGEEEERRGVCGVTDERLAERAARASPQRGPLWNHDFLCVFSIACLLAVTARNG